MKTVIKLSILLVSITFMSFINLPNQDQVKWEIPEKYKKMKNPTDASDRGLLMDAKSIYAKECKSCHGKDGLGDGSKADGLKGYLGDFSDPEFFEDQTDGELFYKIKIGRDDMPAFGKKLSGDEDIWLVINYIKTLAE